MKESCTGRKYKEGDHMWYEGHKCVWGCCKSNGTDAGWRQYCSTGITKGKAVVEIYPTIEGKYCRDYDWRDTGYGWCNAAGRNKLVRIYQGEKNPGDTQALKREFCALGCYKRNVEPVITRGRYLTWAQFGATTKVTHFAVANDGTCNCYGGSCSRRGRNHGNWDLYSYSYSSTVSGLGR